MTQSSNPFAKQVAVTRWRNVSTHPVRVSIHIDHGTPGDDSKNIPAVAPTFHVVTWQPGEEQDVPSEFDRVIQTTACVGGCPSARSMHCTNPDHPRVVMGGQAPTQLQRVNGKNWPMSGEILDAADEALAAERNERNASQRRADIAKRLGLTGGDHE